MAEQGTVKYWNFKASCLKVIWCYAVVVRWLSEIIVTEWIKSSNFAGGFFSTY